MTDPTPTGPTPPLPPSEQPNEFLQAAGEKEQGIVAEFVGFMAENKVWWMTPILVVLGLVGVLLVLGATPAGAFLYSFF